MRDARSAVTIWRNGWPATVGAVPYRDCKCEEVRALSKDAELRNAGIWGGEFAMPWDWRKQHK
jgi:endonuclease YncB( thermonuclease family)